MLQQVEASAKIAQAGVPAAQAAQAAQANEWVKLAAFIGQFFSNMNPFNSASSAVRSGLGVLNALE